MSSAAGNRRPNAAPTSMKRTRMTAAASSSSRHASATSSSLSSTVETSSVALNSTISASSASATSTFTIPSATSTSEGLVGTCSVTRDCKPGRVCSGGLCVDVHGAAPLGGPGEPTSHLSKSSAVGLGVGLIALIALVFGLGLCFWKIRRRPKKSVEAPPSDRLPTPPPKTTTDTKPPASAPASKPKPPPKIGFPKNTMAPALFAKALGHSSTNKEKPDQAPAVKPNQRVDSVTAKDLPVPPSPIESPLPNLPTPPADNSRYTVNVNINKSMILDDEVIITLGPVRESSPLPSHTPKYKLQEYHSPMTKARPISIKPAANRRAPGNVPKQRVPERELSKQISELELVQYPGKAASVKTSATAEDALYDDLDGPEDDPVSKLSSEPPQLPLPPLRPPSTGLNFDSNDWYQYITGTPTSVISRTPGPTPSQTAPSRPLSAAPEKRVPSPLVPAPLNSKSSALRLIPPSGTLTRPSSATFRLSQSALVPPAPTANPARLSVLSTMTRATRNSRSWLPEDGLYLPDEEGSEDAFRQFIRPEDPGRPKTYSPLT